MMLPDNLPALLFAVLVIFAAGGVVFYAIESEPFRYSRWERVAYCYPLGLTALSMPMLVMSWAGFRLHVLPIVLLVAFSAAVAYAIRRVPLTQYVAAQKDAPPRTPLSEMEWFLVGIIVVCVLARTMASLMTPLFDWDGLCVWGLKAKVVYFETVRTSDYFHRRELVYSHQIYPLLWPFMYAWVCTVLGHWDDVGIFILNPINVMVAATLLYYTVRRLTPRMVSLAVTAMFTSLPGLLNYAECAQADVPLMLISGTSLLCLVHWMQSRRRPPLLLAAVLMGGAMFTKEEGKIVLVAHALAAALSILLGAPRAERRKLFGHLGLYLLVAGLWLSPWLLFQRTIPSWNQDFRPVRWDNFRWHEIPTWCHTIIQSASYQYNGVGLPKWNILWPIVVLLIAVSKAPRSYPYNCILAVFLLHLGGLSLVWLCSTVPLTLDGNEFGWERYTLVVSPPIWLLFAKCLEEWWRVWKAPSTQVQ